MCEQCETQKPVSLGTVVKLCDQVVSNGEALAEIRAMQQDDTQATQTLESSILRLRATLTNYK